MLTLEQIKEIKRDDAFYDEISAHWQRRASKLRKRRWREIITRDLQEQLCLERKHRGADAKKA